MADTIRTRATLQSLLSDNVGGDISAQDIRDFLVSTYNWVNDTVGGDIYYTEGDVGIGISNPTGALHVRKRDAVTDDVTNVLTLSHTTSGTAAVGIGTGLQFRCERIDGTDVSQTGKIASILRFNTIPAEDFWDMVFMVRDNDTIVEAIRIKSDGNVGFLNPAPTEAVDATGNIKASGFFDAGGDSIRIRTSQSPAASSTGNQGEIAWDGTYLYGCVSTNTWGRIAWTLGY